MKIGLVLSGGGARGFAHLGVAQALYEKNIKPDMLAGTSAGAIVGAFLAAGYLPEKTLEIITSVNFMKYFRPAISWSGLVKLEKLSDILMEYFPENSFHDLKIPLTIAATNYSKGKAAYFDKGELIKPMLASASIPVIFEPITIGEDLYVDGGILANLPVGPLQKKVDYLIGVNCNPVGPAKTNDGMKDMLERSLLMIINYNTQHQGKGCDLLIQPEKLSNYKVFALSKAKEMYEIGYESAVKALDELPTLEQLTENPSQGSQL